MSKFYKITCLVGHKATHKEKTLTFVIKAKNMLDACDKARKMPSVKHHKIDTIQYAIEISEKEYKEKIKESAYQMT